MQKTNDKLLKFNKNILSFVGTFSICQRIIILFIHINNLSFFAEIYVRILTFMLKYLKKEINKLQKPKYKTDISICSNGRFLQLYNKLYNYYLHQFYFMIYFICSGAKVLHFCVDIPCVFVFSFSP